ncbi:hypothetical protein EVAR_24765_1 [Eumeta japonica]|uniref:Uncharacterized protein n=1 Tax=Eumeta variegata TaxID=151549 RepID=A0A4C1VES5_EUMVA|nr:hypothetical protein EVAR_24765_1 [Eumeta japonica]
MAIRGFGQSQRPETEAKKIRKTRSRPDARREKCAPDSVRASGARPPEAAAVFNKIKTENGRSRGFGAVLVPPHARRGDRGAGSSFRRVGAIYISLAKHDCFLQATYSTGCWTGQTLKNRRRQQM